MTATTTAIAETDKNNKGQLIELNSGLGLSEQKYGFHGTLSNAAAVSPAARQSSDTKRSFIEAFLLSLYEMRLAALILSILLSFLAGERTTDTHAYSQNAGHCSVSESQSNEKTADYTRNRELCIAAAQGYTFAGGGSTNSVLVRVTQSGRRTQPQVRSTFRIIKDGKIIDNNHLHPFLAQSIVHQAGVYISDRYLFSIYSLRL